MGKRGTADFNGQLARYILYKSSLNEVNAAIEQLTAGASEPGDMEPDEATTFFIDATGAGEVCGQACVAPRRPLCLYGLAYSACVRASDVLMDIWLLGKRCRT